ncbi:MAG TPA: sigma-70 family RNA polymerase sigma factor [Steroidobacteraceae bacterium]|jgi:RNA polymerase sigma-70 factor (ECF subfamily)|nr:sigma-70 family RNA polymerase sigma factor [Steroidobacteraceae bacterium]
MMLERAHHQAVAQAAKPELRLVTGKDGSEHDRAQRFHDAALPYLDDVYTLARYLLRNKADAEDATQECYLRALRHFDTYRGPAMKPWLFAILRNICRSEFARRAGNSVNIDEQAEPDEDAIPLWQEAQISPEETVLKRWDADTIRRLLAQLPAAFHETIVLREINELSYSQIAEVVGVPVGTVMSRLARARGMLRQAWIAEDGTRS